MQNAVPGFLGGFREPEQFPVLRIDHALVDQKVEIDRAPPIALAYEHNGQWLDFSGLYQRKDFKQLIESAEAARKGHESSCTQQKMQFAKREIVKSQTEIRRDVWIRILLVGQVDVEARGLGGGVECPSVGGLHDAGTSAGQ